MSAPSLPCAVVGAGLLGLSTAMQLLCKGRAVTLLDANAPGTGASYGNAGFLATESIDPLSTWSTLKGAPNLLLSKHGPLKIPRGNRLTALPWLARFGLAARPVAVSANREALASLNRHAVRAWQASLASIEQQHLLVQSGYLLAWEDGTELRAARSQCSHLEKWGIDVQLVDAHGVDQLEPAFEGKFHHALLFSNAWRMADPKWLCDALFQAFIGLGGQFLQRKVEFINAALPEPQVGWQGGKRQFSKVVVCAGAHSHQLLSPLGVEIPLMAERGYHLHCPAAIQVLKRPVCAVERKIFMSPLDSGFRVVGISELGGTSLPVQEERFQTLRHHAGSLLPGLKECFSGAETWMGMRPTLPDSLPVIDTLPGYQNIAMAFGNQHLGLTQAAISAELVVAKMLDERPLIELHPYRVTRFV